MENTDVTINALEANQGIVPEGWKSPPKLSDLKTDMEGMEQDHTAQVAKIQTWLDNLNVTGAAKRKPVKGRSSAQPKLIRKQAEWRYAALSEPFLSTPDIFNAQPVTWDDRKAAQQNQLVLNHQFANQIDRVNFVDEYVRTAVDEGTVIVKVGWEFEERTTKKIMPIVVFQENPEAAPMHEHLHQLMESNPNEYFFEVPEHLRQAHEMTMERGVPIVPIVTGREWQHVTETVINQPTLEICDYRNTRIDPAAKGNAKKARFIIHSFESTKTELQKDGRYKNLDAVLIQNESPLSSPDFNNGEVNTDFDVKDQPRQKFVVNEYWGFWDIEGTGLVKPILVSWVGNVIVRMEENPFPDKQLPFISTQYLPVRKKNYGEPDGELLTENQLVVGAVTRGMIDTMARSANGQMGTRKDALDAVNQRRFDRGQDYQYNGNVDPRMAFYMHTYPEIPRSAEYMLNMQNNDADSMTGVKAFGGGLSGESLGETATGIRGLLDAASKRELGILRRLSHGIVEIGRKLMSMNAEFLDDTEVIRITNEQFVPVRRDDLAGRIDLKLTISTAEEDQAKAQELAFMLQTMGNNLDWAMTQVILAEVARLRKMPDLAKQIEAYQPQPDPLDQQLKQLEIAKVQAEIAEIQSRAFENQAGGQLDQAKAENLSSDTDQKNLDFVEQESGVKQERELQKQGEQAKGNIELERVKAGLNSAQEQRNQLNTYLKKLGIN